MKSKKPVYEHITQIAVGQLYAVRIWSDLPALEEWSLFNNKITTVHANLATSLAVDSHLLPTTVAAAFLALPETAAVEVLGANRRGVVAYAEWP